MRFVSPNSSGGTWLEQDVVNLFDRDWIIELETITVTNNRTVLARKHPKQSKKGMLRQNIKIKNNKACEDNWEIQSEGMRIQGGDNYEVPQVRSRNA